MESRIGREDDGADRPLLSTRREDSAQMREATSAAHEIQTAGYPAESRAVALSSRASLHPSVWSSRSRSPTFCIRVGGVDGQRVRMDGRRNAPVSAPRTREPPERISVVGRQVGHRAREEDLGGCGRHGQFSALRRRTEEALRLRGRTVRLRGRMENPRRALRWEVPRAGEGH